MNFKKTKGHKPYGVELSKHEHDVMLAEIRKQIAGQARKFEMDNDAAVLLMLHETFGFGEKRLYKAWKLMYAKSKELQNKYEMSAEDGGWLCREKLKEYGVDLEEWYKGEENAENT